MSATITQLNGVAVNVRPSYNYCGVCGHQPRTRNEEPNYAPVRWWDPDDGWKIGTLCRHCHADVMDARPKPGDYACAKTNDVADDVNTDEDPLDALT
jgi:hypothetical protein